MKCEGCGEVSDSIDGLLAHKCRPNTPASDQPEYRALEGKCDLTGIERKVCTCDVCKAFQWVESGAAEAFIRRPIAAEKREERKTTCRNCGAHYEFSATEVALMLQTEHLLRAQISTLQRSVAGWQRLIAALRGDVSTLQQQLAQEKEAGIECERQFQDKVAEIIDLLNNGAHLKFLIKGILDDLPTNRDWLNPDIERAARAAIQQSEGG